MKKNVLRLWLGIVCLGVVLVGLRLQSCSNIAGMGGMNIPMGYGRVMIASNQRSVTDDEIRNMELRYKFNGVDVTTGYMDFSVGTSVTVEVNGYVDGVHRMHHVESPIVVHDGNNVINIALSKTRDEVPQVSVDINYVDTEPKDVVEENPPIQPEEPFVEDDEEEMPEDVVPGPVNLGHYGETLETSHFEHVKDVQWSPSLRTNSRVKASGNCYSGLTKKQTGNELWTKGSYVVLEKNGTSRAGTYFGNTDTSKNIPTYKEIVYTRNADDSYTPTVLADDLIIIGISKQGMMTQVGGHYGGFVYTATGWAESNEGKQEIHVDYEYAYPTEAEIAEALESFRN